MFSVVPTFDNRGYPWYSRTVVNNRFFLCYQLRYENVHYHLIFEKQIIFEGAITIMYLL